ncbi:MAG TPA: histidine triad nucleotide-binding protein [Spirochaetota bacterium]|nr:histidine triad nucleotide-binding protein [Spirochaetota bacterium]HPN81941.1 histidine triad nucleotide-binding protein [Spirochaetota bacterium]
MKDCIFCGIVNGTVPAQKVYEDDRVIAFRDIQPQAPMHILIIPRDHVASLDAVQDPVLIGYIMTTAAKLAREHGVAEGGYRVVVNCNQDGGQTVFHLHAHLLGGRFMTWPPG